MLPVLAIAVIAVQAPAAPGAPGTSPAAQAAQPPAATGVPALDADSVRQALERLDRMQSEIDGLRSQNAEQAREIQDLKAQAGEQWLSEQRAEQVRGTVRDVLADSSTRASLVAGGPTAGYDRNFFVASADGNFRLNLEGQIQVRYAYSHLPTAALSTQALRPPAASGVVPADESQIANEYGFEIRRMQLNFFGNVFDPSLTYRVQVQYQRDAANSGQPIRFADVWMQKALGDGFYFRAGQWKNFFNYEEITSSRTQQFVERSLVNEYFNTKFVQGILLGWESDVVRLYASYNDGGANRDVGVLQSTGNLTEWAFTGRAEWKFLGAWGQFRDMQGFRGTPFAAVWGAAVNWQRAAGDPPSLRQSPGNGTIIPGETQADRVTGVNVTSRAVSEQMTLLTWTTDLNLRGDGWSAWAAYSGNATFAGGRVGRQQGVDGALSQGVVVQGGVFVSNELELMARYEGLWVSSEFDPASYAPNPFNPQTLNIVTVGGNWYFNKNAVKFTLDAGYAFNPVRFQKGLFGEAINGANWRASQTGQGAGEVVIRAQTQLLF
jgi:FtsZ-binding cell division protein ZapB